jgi:hypothetical protein
MSFFKSLFRRSEKVQCPRCLGKGSVDQSDIERMNMQLKWLPGPCAYCEGAGKVQADRIKRLPADTYYVTTGMPWIEKRRLFRGDAHALKRARLYDQNADMLISEIRQLHVEHNLQVHQIANHYFVRYPDLYGKKDQRKEFIKYIELILESL